MPGPSASARGNRPDFMTAAIFVGIGALGLWLSRELEFGALSQMGPGFMPRVVSGLLIAVGLVVGGTAYVSPAEAIQAVRLRPVIVITLSIIVFAYAATHLGFVLAALWLVIAGSMADPGGRLWHTLALAVGLTIFGALVFVYGLGVQVPLWPV